MLTLQHSHIEPQRLNNLREFSRSFKYGIADGRSLRRARRTLATRGLRLAARPPIAAESRGRR